MLGGHIPRGFRHGSSYQQKGTIPFISHNYIYFRQVTSHAIVPNILRFIGLYNRTVIFSFGLYSFNKGIVCNTFVGKEKTGLSLPPLDCRIQCTSQTCIIAKVSLSVHIPASHLHLHVDTRLQLTPSNAFLKINGNKKKC